MCFGGILEWGRNCDFLFTLKWGIDNIDGGLLDRFCGVERPSSFYCQGVAMDCGKMPFQGEAELVRLFF